MNTQPILGRRLARWGVAGLTLITLFLALFLALAGAGRATALPVEPAGAPPAAVYAVPGSNGPSSAAIGRSRSTNTLTCINRVSGSTSYERSHATIYAVPGSDGTSVMVAAGRLGQLAVPVYARVGGTSYERSHTMAYDPVGQEYVHTFEGVLVAQAADYGTIAITTSAATLGSSSYIRHYVPGSAPADLPSTDGRLNLHVSANGVPTETYVLVMPTDGPPGDLPAGHRLIGQAYAVRASGALTQSLKPMALDVHYTPAQLAGADPHTLGLLAWEPAAGQWANLGGVPFFDWFYLSGVVRRFTTYALMATTTWRDTFDDIYGLADWQGVRLAYGGKLELESGATAGWATSTPITLTGDSSAWDRLVFSATTPTGTALTVSVLDGHTGELLLANAADGDCLTGIDPQAHPSLRLRAALSAAAPGRTPSLDEWAISWAPVVGGRRLYLPLLVRSLVPSDLSPDSSPFGKTSASSVEPLRAGSGRGGEMSSPPPSQERGVEGVRSTACPPPTTTLIVWSPPVNLSNNAGHSLSPALAVDAAGTLHAVWYDNSGANLDVYYASRPANAANWSPPVNVSNTPGSSYWPAIAVDLQGNVHVAWDDSTSGRAILYAMRAVGSTTWTAPVNISRSAGTARFVALAADAAGNVHAVWNDNASGNYEIYYAMRPPGDGAWTTPVNVSHTPATSWMPAIAVDPGGGLHVAWHDYTPGTTEIFYASRPNPAAAWSSPANVSRTTGASYSPAIAADSTGAVHLVWADAIVADFGAAFKILYAQKTPLSSNSAPLPPNPSTSSLASSGQDGAGQVPGGEAHPPGLGGWGGYVILSRDTGSAEMPTLAVGPGDALHVAWDTTADPPAILYVRRPAPEMGWTAPLTVTLVSPGAQYPAPSLAASPDESVHLLWSDFDSFSRDIFSSWTAPPLIPENHVLVLDEAGFAVAGACVYRSGAPTVATDDTGVAIPPLDVGDTLAALQQVAQQPTIRQGHTTDDSDGVNWAYRTYLTSVDVAADGSISPYVVTRLGQQRLVVKQTNPLILYNLVVSIEWDATIAYMEQISRAVSLASDYLYDISDGQMAFGHVAIYDHRAHWADADVQFSASNRVTPYAYVGGIAAGDKGWIIRGGRGWDRQANGGGRWDEPDGYHTLIHEFGHYALYLYDEYLEYVYDRGNLVGVRHASCTSPMNRNVSTVATNASIMDWQYTTSELSMRGVAGLWTDDYCTHTVQWQLSPGESAWETLTRHYTDTISPGRWHIVSPAVRGAVMAGPASFPAAVLPFPVIVIANSGTDAPARDVTVVEPGGRRAPETLIVLHPAGGNAIDQGFTDATGAIEVFGAAEGDEIWAASMDGASSGRIVVAQGTAYTLTLGPAAWATAAAGRINPYVSLVPGSDGRTLYPSVQGVEEGGVLYALVAPPGSAAPQRTQLAYSPAAGAYTGTVSFSAVGLGTGGLYVRGLGLQGELVIVDSDFSLLEVDVNRAGDLYSADGNLQVHLEPGSFTGGMVYAVLMPTGAVPQPLPAGRVALGSAYAIRFSGDWVRLARPGLLRLFYHPGLAGDPAGLGIYRWDPTARAWEVLGGELEANQRSVAVPFDRAGIYALLAAEVAPRRAYLPMIAR